MIIDRIKSRVTVTIKGREDISLFFSLSALEELEARTGISVSNLTESPVPNIKTLTDAFWVAYKAGTDRKATREQAQAILNDFMREYGYGEAVKVFYTLIGVCGILGPEASDKLLEAMGEVAFNEGTEGKNEMAEEWGV